MAQGPWLVHSNGGSSQQQPYQTHALRVASDHRCPHSSQLMHPKPNQRQSICFVFYFFTKGLHIINSLTKTKVLVTEFEKHFPSINGK